MAYGLFGFGYVITATFIVVIVRASPAAAAMEPIFWLVLAWQPSPPVALWVAAGRRLGVVRAFAVACVVEAAGVFASVAWPTIVRPVPGRCPARRHLHGADRARPHRRAQPRPDDPRRPLAILTAAFGLGQIVGPIVAGYGFDLTGSFYLPSLLAVAGLLVGAGLALAIDRRRIAVMERSLLSEYDSKGGANGPGADSQSRRPHHRIPETQGGAEGTFARAGAARYPQAGGRADRGRAAGDDRSRTSDASKPTKLLSEDIIRKDAG
jgi:hypothetical protein